LLERAVKFHEKTRNAAAFANNAIVVGGMGGRVS
jgi:hypothetical protein